MVSMAALAAPRSPWPGRTRKLSQPETAITRPPCGMCGVERRTRSRNPWTVRPIVFSTWRPWICPSGLKALAAALATTTSIFPKRSTVCCDERLDSLGLGDVGLDGDRGAACGLDRGDCLLGSGVVAPVVDDDLCLFSGPA